MTKRCPACHTLYARHANFCAVCGQSLVPAGASATAAKNALVIALAVSALVTYAVFARTHFSFETKSRSFDLASDEAAAVFDILRPDDVKVLVRRDRGRVQVTGTPAECDALADFVGLITRYSGQHAHEVHDGMQQARRGWTTHRSYKLPTSKAKALFNALAPNDVPVLVSYRNGDRRIRVDANPQDQETIRRVVDILRGRRL